MIMCAGVSLFRTISATQAECLDISSILLSFRISLFKQSLTTVYRCSSTDCGHFYPSISYQCCTESGLHSPISYASLKPVKALDISQLYPCNQEGTFCALVLRCFTSSRHINCLQSCIAIHNLRSNRQFDNWIQCHENDVVIIHEKRFSTSHAGDASFSFLLLHIMTSIFAFTINAVSITYRLQVERMSRSFFQIP